MDDSFSPEKKKKKKLDLGCGYGYTTDFFLGWDLGDRSQTNFLLKLGAVKVKQILMGK